MSKEEFTKSRDYQLAREEWGYVEEEKKGETS